MSDVVILAGGSPHAHDFEANGRALARMIGARGHAVEVIDDPTHAASRLAERPADALVVNGLWWRMLGESYDRWRDRFGYSPSEPTRAALTKFVHDGGGLVAMHTASICFDDWPAWSHIVGGGWRWGVSSHPPVGPVEARVVATHPVVAGLDALTLVDEVYGDQSIDDAVEVLAVARRSTADREQPVVWAHRYGAGRVIYDGFGHDVASIERPEHVRLIEQALGWVLGSSDEAVGAVQ